MLQTQLCLLLDPFYEAKYPEHMYAYRKGRNTHQAMGFLKTVLEQSDARIEKTWKNKVYLNFDLRERLTA